MIATLSLLSLTLAHATEDSNDEDLTVSRTVDLSIVALGTLGYWGANKSDSF